MSYAAPLDPGTRRRVLLPFLLVTLIWGSTWTVIRGQIGPVPVSWSVCYRFLVAGLTMLAVARAQGVSLRLSARDHLFLLAMGGSIFCCNFNFVYRAEEHVTSGLVAVCFSLLVVANAVLARFALGQAVSRPFLLGAAVAMGGVALLFVHELHAAVRPAGEVLRGIGFTLVAVMFASIANVMQGAERARAMPMATLLAWSMLWGAGLDALYAWITTGPPVIDSRPMYLGGVLYLGVIASALAFLLYFTMIRAIGPARGGYVNVLVPVIAMGFSTVLEDYRWSATAAAGGVLVVAGLVLSMRARSPAR